MTFSQHALRLVIIVIATVASVFLASAIVASGRLHGDASLSAYVMVTAIGTLTAWFFTYVVNYLEQGCGGGDGTGRMGCGGW